jgi:hypothetical protein
MEFWRNCSFPKAAGSATERRVPDMQYVRKELQKNGVTKKLLWTEYLEECRQAVKSR